MTTPARYRSPTRAERLRLVKAELLLALAVTASRWARGETGLSAPDLLEDLAARYRVAVADVAAQVEAIAGELERRAERAGYEGAWR